MATLRLWPSLPPSVHVRASSGPLPFPLGQSGCRLYSRGRHALWHGVRALGLGHADEILVPAYHCGTEVEALRRAGLECRFFEATDDLAPDTDELDSLVTPRTRALLMIHYFGFPQDGPRWRAWCDRHGLLLVEDCAHGLFVTLDERPVGTFGQLAIYSFAKTLPIPDGGAAVGELALPQTRGPQQFAFGAVAKRHVRWAMQRSARLDRVLWKLERPYDERLDLGDPHRRPSRATGYLLPRVARTDVAHARRDAYRRLLHEFPSAAPAPFDRLPSGASPLFFPLSTAAGFDLDRVRSLGVAAEPFWPSLHPMLDVELFPKAVAWHGRFVALPVHQELRAVDVERIAAALRHARQTRTRRPAAATGAE